MARLAMIGEFGGVSCHGYECRDGLVGSQQVASRVTVQNGKVGFSKIKFDTMAAIHVRFDCPAKWRAQGPITLYPWTDLNDAASVAEDESAPVATDRVFIVHGHDDVMKLAVARAITDLGLKPIILHEQPNAGKTIIEKFERDSDVGFAVASLSPDDMAYASAAEPNTAKPRARQNVVLELGYFVGSIGRDRVMALKRGNDLQVPSDFNGVVYTQYDDAGNWKFEPVRELKVAGYNVDANALI